MQAYKNVLSLILKALSLVTTPTVGQPAGCSTETAPQK